MTQQVNKIKEHGLRLSDFSSDALRLKLAEGRTFCKQRQTPENAGISLLRQNFRGLVFSINLTHESYLANFAKSNKDFEMCHLHKCVSLISEQDMILSLRGEGVSGHRKHADMLSGGYDPELPVLQGAVLHVVVELLHVIEVVPPGRDARRRELLLIQAA